MVDQVFSDVRGAPLSVRPVVMLKHARVFFFFLLFVDMARCCILVLRHGRIRRWDDWKKIMEA